MAQGVQFAGRTQPCSQAGRVRTNVPRLQSCPPRSGFCGCLPRRCGNANLLSSSRRGSNLLTFATTGVLEASDGLCYLQGCTKVLHLYEDKDLELLDAVLYGTVNQDPSASCDGGDPIRECSTTSAAHTGQQQGARARVFVHTTIEMGSSRMPCVACASSTPGALVAGEFVFFLSTLVQVLDVQPAIHGGVDVTIRGEGRVSISRLKQLNPYITGEVRPVQDVVPRDVLNPPLHHEQIAPSATDAPPAADVQQCPVEEGLTNGSAAQLQVDTQAPAWPSTSVSSQAMGNNGASRSHPARDMVSEQEQGRPAEAQDAGWALQEQVHESRKVAEDILELMCKLGREQQAGSLAAALEWADDPTPLICNLGSGKSSADLWLLPPTDGTTDTDMTRADTQQLDNNLGNTAPAVSCMAALPCALSHLDRATRLSFALLAVAQCGGPQGGGPDMPSWAGSLAAGDLRRAAMCTLDTRERLNLVLETAKSVRARLAAQAALWRVRRF